MAILFCQRFTSAKSHATNTPLTKQQPESQMHYTIIVKAKTFRFDTMEQAIAVAGAIFKETGVVVGIEAVAS
jgi:hypothetical protein